ncbi:hypothetical protein PQS90_13990 [Pseudomonas sp. BLCC-B13]|uniref:hypothetical protein n=1 Tax=Pseudomonas sp. BLCC-B13 TaxID=3025314 RepID=UPI00234E65FA|nr:hypothetical protein [Pseudomonas sp. BLCC-B13]MDC7826263.1 hypothetical protein [Pseudomonas sp. BLCC-B13]
MRTLLLTFSLLFFSEASRGDWVVVGVAYQCSPQEQKFVLAATADSSSGPLRLNGLSSYTQLPDGETKIQCKLPTADITTEIVVWPPADRGMCHGIGVINFPGLSINGSMAVNPENFGDGCFFEPTLARIEVHSNAKKISVTTCYESDIGSEQECEEKQLPITGKN